MDTERTPDTGGRTLIRQRPDGFRQGALTQAIEPRLPVERPVDDAGSTAEAVYQHLRWQRVGEIPGYARSPDGSLHATVYYFKVLSA